MATTGDPWRTLGLAPGASLDDVRRAYRRLAKANHPDAAGEAALPRFLAIQAAYEAIAGPSRGRRVGARPSGASSRPTPPAEPWRADPERARASGRADGRRPGSRPTGRPAGGPTSGGPRTGPASSGASAGGGTGPAGPSERARAGSSGRARRSSSKRGPKTRGPYATSYDAADEEPFEPGWSGATWYGASSGTYWTINPKEYADPRKHGPEYQARARRVRGGNGWIGDDSGEPSADAAPAGAAAPADEAASPERREEREWPPRAETATDGPRSRPPRARRPHPPSAWTAASAPPREESMAGSPRDGEPPPPAPPPTAAPAAAAGTPSGAARAPVLPLARTGGGRAATALVGWPPLALFAASAIGESTGCGRYAASCAEASSPGTWVVALAILVLLLAAPPVARWSAHGTLAVVLIGVPSAVILSAAGGTNVREASAPILLGVLAVAYLVGVVYAVIAPRLLPGRETVTPGSLR